MRQNVPEQFQESVRQVQARARVAQDRPVFEHLRTLGSTSAYSKLTQTWWGSDFCQLALKPGDNTLYEAKVPLGSLFTRSFAPSTDYPTVPAGSASSEAYRALAAYDDGSGTKKYIAYAVSGKVYFAAVGTPWKLLHDFTDGVIPKISLALTYLGAVVVAATYSGSSVTDRCEISIFPKPHLTTTRWVWPGYLPRHTTAPGIAAVRLPGSVDTHIFVDDWNGKKPLYLKVSNAGNWSAAREILPMDALDDESAFQVGYAAVLSGSGEHRLYLTGTLKRKYGPSYSIYLLGPEEMTFGRDLIVAGDYALPCQLVWDGSALYAVSARDVYASPCGGDIFPFELAFEDLDLGGFSLDSAANQGERLSFDLPAGSVPASLTPGARIDLEVKANDSGWLKLGQFGVDRLRRVEGEEGQSFSVDCSSAAMKRLLDWQSDTYFDYLGQGEVHGDPGDLTKLIRLSGGSYSTPDGLQLDSLNQDGILYTTTSASHGGFIRASFHNLQADSTMVGVGLNYGEESLAEAAARLKKKLEQVKAGERGRWALFAVYVPDPLGSASPKVFLVDYNTLRKDASGASAPYRVIASANVLPPGSDGIQLAMQYQDGYARVYYTEWSREEGTFLMELVISASTLLEKEVWPVEHENYGRGAIFLRNNSGFHMAYPVMSDSDVIPLYSTAEKNAAVGVPLEDRPDKFPASNGTVLIDSEEILYSGLAGWSPQKRTEDLQWVPGKLIGRSLAEPSTPSGTTQNFAQDRDTNNYLLQRISVPAGTIISAVRVWVGKTNFPEDGIMVTINVGEASTDPQYSNQTALTVSTSVYNQVVIPTEQIKPEGGWVTAYFEGGAKIAAGQKYWIMLRRSKNWTHPASGSYFHTKVISNSSYGSTTYEAYRFAEENDSLVPLGGDIPFELYGRLEDINKEFCFPVKYQTGKGLPASGTNFFLNQALTITAGGGKDTCYRIVRDYHYTDAANDLWIFWLDRNPGYGIFNLATRARAVPAFYGLKRGQSSTLAAAHGGKSLVHKKLAAKARADHFEYFTADEDLTLAEVARSVARKAGVVNVDLSNRHSGQVVRGEPIEYIEAQSKNALLDITIPELDGDPNTGIEVHFCNSGYPDPEGKPQPVFIVSLTYPAGLPGVYGVLEFVQTRYYWTEHPDPELPPYWHGVGGPVLTLPLREPVEGKYRISLHDNHCSVWCGGRLLGAVGLEDYPFTWDRLYVSAEKLGTVSAAGVVIPQASARVDYFSMDMGKSGNQLLQTLVGEKRVYFRDDGSGGLVVYTDREEIPTPYTRAVSLSRETTDVGLGTRILLEGGEVVEVSNAGNLAEWGNFFRTFNITQINNLDDAAYFAALILEDMALNRERVEIGGAADPRLQPTDELVVPVGGVQKRVVVDTVAHVMRVDENEAVYDMRVSGRVKEAE